MKRGFVFALAAALSACAPAPAANMPAAQASEVLNLFAAGHGPANLCSADGRALLRGAVRAYSREMTRSGMSWPVMPGAAGQNVTNVDASVMIAFAAGFVKAGDFHGAPGVLMNQLAISDWPEIRSMRVAAQDACAEVMALQQAATSFVIESTRYREMTSFHGAAERLERQSVRLRRARERMQDSAAIVEARLR